jgi:hypothetical protein
LLGQVHGGIPDDRVVPTGDDPDERNGDHDGDRVANDDRHGSEL